MQSLLIAPALQAFAIASSLLVVTLFGLAFHTAATRGARKVVVNPEDLSVSSGATVALADHEDVQRIKRAHQNLLENATPFFVIGLLFALTDPNLLFARLLFGLFVLLRVLHGAFYLQAKQPFRTLCFVVGALINLVMVEEVLRALLMGGA